MRHRLDFRWWKGNPSTPHLTILPVQILVPSSIQILSINTESFQSNLEFISYNFRFFGLLDFQNVSKMMQEEH